MVTHPSPVVLSNRAVTNDPQPLPTLTYSERPPHQVSYSIRDLPERTGNHGKVGSPHRKKWSISSMIGKGPAAFLRNLFQPPLDVEDNSPRFSSHPKASKTPQFCQAINPLPVPVPSFVAQKPLPLPGDPLVEQAQRSPLPRPKAVRFSGHLEFIPPSPEFQEPLFPEARSLSSLNPKNIPLNHSIRRKPVPQSPSPAHSVLIRKTPLPSPSVLDPIIASNNPIHRKPVNTTSTSLVPPVPMRKADRTITSVLGPPSIPSPIPRRKPSSTGPSIMHPVPERESNFTSTSVLGPPSIPSPIPRRKPVPTNSSIAQPAPMREHTPTPPSERDFLPSYTCSCSLSKPFPDIYPDYLPVIPVEIRDAQARVKAVVESEGYLQFRVDQQLVESFYNAFTGSSKTRQDQSSLWNLYKGSPAGSNDPHLEFPTGKSTPRYDTPRYTPHVSVTYANKPWEVSPNITNYPAPASLYPTAQLPRPLPLRKASSQKFGAPGEVAYELEPTRTMERVPASPTSFADTEDFSVVLLKKRPKRPKKLPPRAPVPRGLRLAQEARSQQPDLRQRFSFRNQLRKALTSSWGNRRHNKCPLVSRKQWKRNLDPDDWYPPRKHCSTPWRPAGEILSNQVPHGEGVVMWQEIEN